MNSLGLFNQQFNTIYRCFSVSILPENEWSDVERGGKIIMPTSALNTLTRLNIVYPMLFKLTNCYNRFTHCGVLEFVGEEGKVYLPQWMMKNLVLEEGSLVQVESVSLPMSTFTKFQPRSHDFLDIPNPKTALKDSLRNFDCLTTGDVISITYNDKEYELSVIETKPGAAVSIIECDMNMEFATPVGNRETENMKQRDKYESKDKKNGDDSSYQLLLTVISEDKSKYSEDLITFEEKDNQIDEKLKELTPKESTTGCKTVQKIEKQKIMKVSVGTQTLRSYLREQSLKQNSGQINKQNPRKRSQTKLFETKAIQTSYTSHSSESDSTVINEKCNSLANLEQIERLGIGKVAISWFIPISKNNGNKNITQISKPFGRTFNLKSKSYEHIMTTSSPVPLQEAFNRHCIDMRINSQIRVNRINTIADLRKQTADERLIEMAKQFIRQQESAKVIKTKVIQPVFKSTIKRFFTHEEMRAQTEKIYHNLPEVKAKREKQKQIEKEKNQRLLTQIYKYRLKDNALKGRLTWKITQSCLN